MKITRTTVTIQTTTFQTGTGTNDNTDAFLAPGTLVKMNRRKTDTTNDGILTYDEQGKLLKNFKLDVSV